MVWITNALMMCFVVNSNVKLNSSIQTIDNQYPLYLVSNDV
jgi:hypothetical protein